MPSRSSNKNAYCNCICPWLWSHANFKYYVGSHLFIAIPWAWKKQNPVMLVSECITGIHWQFKLMYCSSFISHDSISTISIKPWWYWLRGLSCSADILVLTRGDLPTHSTNIRQFTNTMTCETLIFSLYRCEFKWRRASSFVKHVSPYKQKLLASNKRLNFNGITMSCLSRGVIFLSFERLGECLFTSKVMIGGNDRRVGRMAKEDFRLTVQFNFHRMKTE
jgi:hypothetical protein